MFPDLGFVFTWWLFIFGIGLIFLPLTKKIFADFLKVIYSPKYWGYSSLLIWSGYSPRSKSFLFLEIQFG